LDSWCWEGLFRSSLTTQPQHGTTKQYFWRISSFLRTDVLLTLVCTCRYVHRTTECDLPKRVRVGFEVLAVVPAIGFMIGAPSPASVNEVNDVWTYIELHQALIASPSSNNSIHHAE